MEMDPDILEGLGAAGGVMMIVWMVVGVVMGIVCLIISIWVGFDASNRRQPGFVWFLLTFMFFPVGLTAWLLARAYLSGQQPPDATYS